MIQPPQGSSRILTAAELLKLPADERDAILQAAAEILREDYLNDPELTAFEAFSQEPPYVDPDSNDNDLTSKG